MSKDPILSFNKETGLYEGLLHIQVDAEIFRRLLIKAVEEDETADLTDPTTWLAAINKVGKITNWLDKPHVTITPIKKEVPMQPLPQEVPPEAVPWISPLEIELREKAMHLPPHVWEEQLLTPLTDAPFNDPDKKRTYAARAKEREYLRKFQVEYEHGEFALDEEAMQQEKEHDGREESKLTIKLETVALAVNGSQFH